MKTIKLKTQPMVKKKKACFREFLMEWLECFQEMISKQKLQPQFQKELNMRKDTWTILIQLVNLLCQLL